MPAAASRPALRPEEEIARGPLGAVFRGEDAIDGRSVAMRMLNPRAAEVARRLAERARRRPEGRVAALAPEPGQGDRAHGVGGRALPGHRARGGRNFAEAIASGRRLGFQQVHALGRVVAQVLALLHEKGLVHGSIQPSNMMVASGVIKLADLGLGRLGARGGPPPSYHAPEGGPSPADDLYALCAVMYHLLTGTHPLSQAQGVGLPLPSQLAPGVPEAMDKLLLRGLHPRARAAARERRGPAPRAARDGQDRLSA